MFLRFKSIGARGKCHEKYANSLRDKEHATMDDFQPNKSRLLDSLNQN